MKKALIFAVLVASAAFSQASFTVATFADPALNSSTPVFNWDKVSNTLSGGWTAAGLTLQAPGLIGGGTYTNAILQVDKMTLTTVIPNTYYTIAKSQVRILSSSNEQILTIDFDSGSFLNPTSLGASDLVFNNVKFSGTKVPAGWTDESFAFSLANAEARGDNITYTSSFTSSASVVPEPATLFAVATGLTALLRRKRKA